MKTKREIVYSVIEFISGFNVTDDSPYDEQLIGDKVDDVRALLIKQQWAQQRKVDDEYYQLQELKIEHAPITDSDDAVKLYSFSVTFPPLLSGIGWDNIKYLGKKNMAENYNRRSMSGYSAARGRRWSQKYVDYTVIDATRAIIRNEKLTKEIIIHGLFKSPTDVDGCTFDTPYPVPDPFKLEMIVKQDIGAGLGIPPDLKNDARHNTEQLTGQRE